MAARKTAVAAPVKTSTEVSTHVATPLAMSAEDVALDRLRVVGRQAKLVELEIAKPGDIAIGQDAEDEDSTIAHTKGGDPVRFYVLDMWANYACGFDGPKGQWNEGDPEMPADAKRQFNYLLCIPSFDERFPVRYTASSSAAGVFKKVNGAIMRHEGPLFELAWDLSTKINMAGTNTWPGPVVKRAEADTVEVAIAAKMYAAMGLGSKPAPASDDTEPGF